MLNCLILLFNVKFSIYSFCVYDFILFNGKFMTYAIFCDIDLTTT